MPYTYNTIHEKPFVFAIPQLPFEQIPLRKHQGKLYWLKSIGGDGRLWMEFPFDGDPLKGRLEEKNQPVIPLMLVVTSGAGDLFLAWNPNGYDRMRTMIETILLA